MFVAGGADAPVASGASKQTEVSTPQRTTRTLPKAPTSQSASMTSEITGPTTPAKGMHICYLSCLFLLCNNEGS